MSIRQIVLEIDPPRQQPADAPDLELFLALRNDDTSALAKLLERHWAPIVEYVARMQIPPDVAEDVAQEVFVQVWQHRLRWQSTGSATAFLYRIAHNLALKNLRHGKVRARTAGQVRETLGAVATPFDNVAFRELREAFESALGALPERRREAFVLVRFQGLSLHEAAEVMELAPQTVANHVTLAVADLRRRIEPYLT